MSTENEIKGELSKVGQELKNVEKEIQKLLDKQELLKSRQAELKHKLQQLASEKLASVNWERQDHPWSEKLFQVMENTFKIKKLRPFQLSAINATLSGQDCILIMPTGGGKSLCFQLPALLSPGITLVVSPLVSLMEDQLMALKYLNVPAAMLSATCSPAENKDICNAMTDKNSPLKLLYVTPEKLSKSKRFMMKLEKMYAMGRFSRLAVDEVHCCSQWGHDFRPDYKILGVMKRLFPNTPIIGLTATATSRVVSDVQKFLNIPGTLVLKASFNRPNLKYEVYKKSSNQQENVAELYQLIKERFPGKSGIVYCFSIKESEDIAAELRKHGLKVRCYHAQLASDKRTETHRLWSENKIQIIVATVAFGMGIDKPDVRFVIHYSLSKSMENFYQESGRAGRDDKPSYCILFYKLADVFRQSTMVFVENTGLPNLYGMVQYCLDISRCRREIIAEHFDERWDKGDCNNMCDHCCPSYQGTGMPTDITDECLKVYKIIEFATKKDERLTAVKLIDAWQGKGPSKTRPSDLKPTTKSREMCERIIGLLLINDYLKEDFHFTPYSSISYLVSGLKSKSVLEGKHRVILEMYALKKGGSAATSVGSTSKSKDSSTSTKRKLDICCDDIKTVSARKTSKSTEAQSSVTELPCSPDLDGILVLD